MVITTFGCGQPGVGRQMAIWLGQPCCVHTVAGVKFPTG